MSDVLRPSDTEPEGPSLTVLPCVVEDKGSKSKGMRPLSGCAHDGGWDDVQGCAECSAHRTGGGGMVGGGVEAKTRVCILKMGLSFWALFEISFFPTGKFFLGWVGGLAWGGGPQITPPPPADKRIPDDVPRATHGALLLTEAM